MKIEARVFLTHRCSASSSPRSAGIGQTAPTATWSVAGFAALILSGGLFARAARSSGLVSGAHRSAPEDRDDAEIAEGAGQLGLQPRQLLAGLALSATAPAPKAMVQAWLMALGVAMVLTTVSGLLFEYYIGDQPLRGRRRPKMS